MQGNAPRRGPRPLRRPAHHVHRLQNAVHRAGVGGEDDGVARLHTDHGFIDHGGGGVGGGHQPRHNAHRHADINGALLPVFRQDAVGLFVSDGLIEGGGGKAVFKLFILFFAEARLLHRHVGQPPGVFPGGCGDGRRYFVQLLLAHTRQRPLCLLGLPEQLSCLLNGLQILVQMVHLVLSGGGRTQFAPASPGRPAAARPTCFRRPVRSPSAGPPPPLPPRQRRRRRRCTRSGCR